MTHILARPARRSACGGASRDVDNRTPAAHVYPYGKNADIKNPAPRQPLPIMAEKNAAPP